MFTIMKILAIIAGFVIFFGIPLAPLYIDKKRRAKIPNMTVDELRQMAEKYSVIYSNAIVKELLSRGEDISFAMPFF